MNQFEKYMEADGFQKKEAMHILDEFSDEIAEIHGKCIDIGCGPGVNTAQLILPKLHKDSTVVGCDISKDAIELARIKNAMVKRLSFIELDISVQKLPPELIGSFDIAISTFCLHWCPEPSQAFKNIYDLLRPGGKALIIMVIKYLYFPIYQKLYEYSDYQPYMKDLLKFKPYFHDCINPRALAKDIIKKTGFQVLHCSQRECTYTYKDLNAARGHLIALDPFIKRMPDDIKKKYEKDMLHELLNSDYLYVTAENKINNSSIENNSLLVKCPMLFAYFQKQ